MNNDSNNDTLGSVNREGHAIAYNASIVETVRTMDEIVGMHPDLLQAIVDSCNSRHNGTEPSADTVRMLDDLVGPDIAPATLDMVGEYCDGDTNPMDLRDAMMNEWPLEVLVTRPMGTDDPHDISKITLAVTVGGPRCEVEVDGSYWATVTTWWWGEHAAARVHAPNLSPWWFDYVYMSDGGPR